LENHCSVGGIGLAHSIDGAGGGAQIVSCEVHPTQPHFVAVGDADGAVHLWDLRRPDVPRGSYQSHTSLVAAVAFHGGSPSNFASASADGTALWWGFDGAMASTAAHRMRSVAEFGSRGFEKGDFELLEVHSEVLPVNAIAIDPRTSLIVTGSDAEALVARRFHLT
jgi:WD40 repeat protein